MNSVGFTRSVLLFLAVLISIDGFAETAEEQAPTDFDSMVQARIDFIATVKETIRRDSNLPDCDEEAEAWHECWGHYVIRNSMYTGEWRNNLQDGIGVTFYESGAYYVGNSSKGYRHGHGVFTFPDDTEERGLFENDHFVGK